MPDYSGTINAGGIAQEAIGAEPGRSFLLVHNPSSSEDLCFNFSGTAAIAGTAGSIRLAPGRTWQRSGPGTPVGAISIVAVSGGHPYTVVTDGDPAAEQLPGSFRTLSELIGQSGGIDAVVGQGPAPATLSYYCAFQYPNFAGHIVQVDPATGAFQVFALPDVAQPEWVHVGPDSLIYTCGANTDKLYRITPLAGTLTDLGRATATETVLYELANGSDGLLYGCTYPNAKLIRFNTATLVFTDLGTLFAGQAYARHITAGGDGWLYITIGLGELHCIAYRISDGLKQDVLPALYQNPIYTLSVYKASDGVNYLRIQLSGADVAFYSLAGGVATLSTAHFADTKVRLAADLLVRNFPTTTIVTTNNAGAVQSTAPFLYTGSKLSIWRFGLGNDGALYMSGVLPANLAKMPAAKAGAATILGNLGSGEFYNLLGYSGRLLLAGYGTNARLMDYDLTRAFQATSTVGVNPVYLNPAGVDAFWRPVALVRGANGNFFGGAIAPYGLLTGHLVEYNPVTRTLVHVAQPVTDQGISSIAVSGSALICGTTVFGGGGSTPTQPEAKLFHWDPATHTKSNEIVPMAGKKNITNMITLADGKILGFNTVFQTYYTDYFVYDPVGHSVIASGALPFTVNQFLQNCVGLAGNGRAYGLYSDGIFRVNPTTRAPEILTIFTSGYALTGTDPGNQGRITGGFALDGNALWFSSGSLAFRYLI